MSHLPSQLIILEYLRSPGRQWCVDYLEGSDEQEGRVGVGSRWSKGPEEIKLDRVGSFMNIVVELLGSIVEPEKDPEPTRWYAQEPFEAAQWQKSGDSGFGEVRRHCLQWGFSSVALPTCHDGLGRK